MSKTDIEFFDSCICMAFERYLDQEVDSGVYHTEDQYIKTCEKALTTAKYLFDLRCKYIEDIKEFEKK